MADKQQPKISDTTINLLYQKAREWKLGQSPEGQSQLQKERSEFLGRGVHTGFKAFFSGRNRQDELYRKHGEIQALKKQGFDTEKLEDDFYNSQDAVDHLVTSYQHNIAQYDKGIVGDVAHAMGFKEAFTPEQEKFIKYKAGQQKKKDPIKALGGEVLTDPITFAPIPFIKGATMTERFVKNAAVGAGFSGTVEYAKHGGDDDFSWKNVGIAAAFGSAANGVIGAAIGPRVRSVADLPNPKSTPTSTFLDDDILEAESLLARVDAETQGPGGGAGTPAHAAPEDSGIDIAFTRGADEAVREIEQKAPVYDQGVYDETNQFFGVEGWDNLSAAQRAPYVEDMLSHRAYQGDRNVNPVGYERPNTADVIPNISDIVPPIGNTPTPPRETPGSAMTTNDITQYTNDEDALNFVHKAWYAIRDRVGTDGIFSYKTYRGSSTNLQDIADDVMHGVTINRNGARVPLRFTTQEHDNVIQIRHANPQGDRDSVITAYKDHNGNIHSINAMGIGQGNNGAAMYHILAEWAHKNGKSIRLNNGFTPANMLQRPTHVFSTLLRSRNRANVFRPASDVNLPIIQGSNVSNRFGRSALGVLYSYTNKVGRGYDNFSFNPETGKFMYRGSDVSLADFGKHLERELSQLNGVPNIGNRGHRQAIVTKGLLDHFRKNPELRNGGMDELVQRLGQAVTDDVDVRAGFGNIAYFHPSIGGAGVGAMGSSQADIDGDGQKGTIKDILYGALAGAVVGFGIKHLSDRSAIIAENKRFSEVSADAQKVYSAAREDTINRLKDLRTQLEERLTTAPSGLARRNLRHHIDRIDTHMANINRIQNFDDLLAATRNTGFREYLQDKARPVVLVSEENLDRIAQSVEDGDLHSATELIDFNINRIDTQEEVEALINSTSEIARAVIDRARRGTQTFEDITRNAEDFGMDITKLNQLYGDTNMLAEKVLAGKMLFIRITEDAIALGKKAREGVATDSDKIEFKRLLAVQASVQAQYKASQTEVARALAAMRITTRARRGSPQEELQKILGELDSNGQLDAAMRDYITATPRQQSEMARVLSHRKGMEVLGEIFINSILSGPWTHFVNMTSNTIMATEGLVEGVIKSRNIGEAKATIFGFMRGTQEAFGAAFGALKHGESYLDHMDKIELSKAIDANYLLKPDAHPALVKAVNVIGEIVRLPGRFLTAEDEFFKTISYRMKLHQLAYRKALEEAGEEAVDPSRVSELMQDVDLWVQAKHTSGAHALEADAHNELLDTIREMDNGYTQGLEEMYETSLEVARDRTFTAMLGERGRSVQNLLTKNPEARFIMPFVRTPVNILKYFGNRIPLVNLINDDYSKVLTKALTPGVKMSMEDIDKLKEFTYRTMMGGSLLFTGFELAKNEVITGGIPKKSSSMKEAGWRPYSILIDGKYYPYNRFDPAAMFIGTMADVYSILNVDDRPNTATDEIMMAAMISVSNNFLNKTYMSGLSTAVGAWTSDNPREFSNWANGLATAFVPAAVNQYNKSLDPVDREAFDMIDAFKNKIPTLSTSLVPKRDYRGREKERAGIYGPLSGSDMKDHDKLDQEVVRLEMDFGPISKTIEGMQLKPEQYDFIVKEAGSIFQEQALKVVNNPEWETKYTDGSGGYEGSKSLVLKQLMQYAREAAKKKAIQHFDDLKSEYKDEKANQMEALLPGVI